MAAPSATLDTASLTMVLHDAGYNGDCFLGNTSGELEEEKPLNRVLFLPRADGLLSFEDIEDKKLARTRNNEFFLVNAAQIHRANKELPRGNIHRAAMMRLWLALMKAYQPDDSPQVHNCRYTDCKAATQEDIKYVATSEITPNKEEATALDAWARKNQKNMLDIVCLVAFIFRQRGHHYLDDLAGRYSELWRSCQREEDNPGLPWDLIATCVCHGIFPDTLDARWIQAVAEGQCVGALGKRIDCAPAGAAIWSTLRTAYNDLAAAAAGLKDKLADARDVLDRAEVVIAGHRWAGSVNRRFYGGPAIEVNETDVAAIAGVTKACLEAFAPDHPMLRSIALNRVAANAPIVGAMLKMGISTAAKSEAYSATLLLTQED